MLKPAGPSCVCRVHNAGVVRACSTPCCSRNLGDANRLVVFIADDHSNAIGTFPKQSIVGLSKPCPFIVRLHSSVTASHPRARRCAAMTAATTTLGLTQTQSATGCGARSRAQARQPRRCNVATIHAVPCALLVAERQCGEYCNMRRGVGGRVMKSVKRNAPEWEGTSSRAARRTARKLHCKKGQEAK